MSLAEAVSIAPLGACQATLLKSTWTSQTLISMARIVRNSLGHRTSLHS